MAQAAVFFEEINEEELKILQQNDSKPVLIYESPKKAEEKAQEAVDVHLPDLDH